MERGSKQQHRQLRFGYHCHYHCLYQVTIATLALVLLTLDFHQRYQRPVNAILAFTVKMLPRSL